MMPPGASQAAGSLGFRAPYVRKAAHWSLRSAGCWIQFPLPCTRVPGAGPPMCVSEFGTSEVHIENSSG
ncbi:MAG: hypothetical protein DMD83_05045 [Candidatus Rokuibacteriota bacterium]|nr:MAG: hypothetical protein DMD83_05045 [Candidatus Rokubacteria bacterium]